MKQTLVILCLLLSLHSHSQNFCPPGATWFYGWSWFAEEGYVEAVFEKDTLYAGKSCRKIQETTHYVDQSNWTTGSRKMANYLAKDSRRVWGYSHRNQWELLYDFSLLPGDSFHVFNSADSVYYFISDTGSRRVNGTSLRWWKLECRQAHWPIQDTLYEMLGTMQKYPFGGDITMMDGGYGHLCNYYDSSFSNWNPNPAECTKMITGLAQAEISPVKISTEPGQIIFQFTGLQNSTCAIYSICGQLIQRFSVMNDVLVLNTTRLTPGMYLLQMQGKVAFKFGVYKIAY